MKTFISWNIQAGRGVDGVIDLRRIARVIETLGGADVICLQEVARRVPEIDQGADQVAVLADLFPDYEAFFGPAVDRLGGTGGSRQAFGNLLLSRLPVLQVFRHPLPQPPDPAVKNMPRQALEAVIETISGPLRVITTHLEYFSSLQRGAQIERLRDLQREAEAASRHPVADSGTGIFSAAPRPASLVLCGDFNCVAGGDRYRQLRAPFPERGNSALEDAWIVAHPQEPHAPTCGIFDRDQWQQGSHCRDFFFVTRDLASRVETLDVDVETDASDHQPLRLVLRD